MSIWYHRNKGTWQKVTFWQILPQFRTGSMRNLRCALWAQENCCWLKRYTLANRKNKVESLTHACASLCSFKHGYLSLQKCSLQQYFIKKLQLLTWFHNCRFYPSKNTPYSVAFSEKAPPFRFLTSQSSWQIGCRFSVEMQVNLHFDTPRHNRAYASQSSFRHGGWAAKFPGR